MVSPSSRSEIGEATVRPLIDTSPNQSIKSRIRNRKRAERHREACVASPPRSESNSCLSLRRAAHTTEAFRPNSHIRCSNRSQEYPEIRREAIDDGVSGVDRRDSAVGVAKTRTTRTDMAPCDKPR